MQQAAKNGNASTKVRWIPVEELTQPQTKAAYAYWRQICGGRLMPDPKSINPIEIPRMLPYVALVDVLNETPPDYCFRIEGELVQTAIGFRRMGHRFSEFKEKYGAVYERATQRFEAVCISKEPRAQTSILTGLGRSFYTIEVISLPLSFDGHTVHRIFHCIGLLKGPTPQ